MVRLKGVLLITMLLFSTILLVANPFQGSSGVLAYYDDIKSTNGCSIIAPENTTVMQNNIPSTPQSGNVTIAGFGLLDADGKILTGPIISNDIPVTITNIGITFTNTPNQGMQVSNIMFGTSPFGDGKTHINGNVVNIEGSQTLSNGIPRTLSISFSKDVRTFGSMTIVLTLSDGSTKTIVI